MAEVNQRAGLGFSTAMEHRDSKGNLIAQQVSIEPPRITCIRPSCLWKYLVKSEQYVWIMLYHKHRMEYCEAHRHDDIEEKYRTGDPSPQNIRESIIEIIRLKLK